MRLVYSAEAVADLVRLREFIAVHDANASARVAEDLIKRFDQLLRFPEIGRCVPEAPEPEMIRDAIFGKYVVRYTIHPSSIVTLRIWHLYENRAGP